MAKQLNEILNNIPDVSDREKIDYLKRELNMAMALIDPTDSRYIPLDVRSNEDLRDFIENLKFPIITGGEGDDKCKKTEKAFFETGWNIACLKILKYIKK